MQNLENIFERFPTHEDCVKYLELLIWNNVPTCPYCKSNRTSPLRIGYRHHCNNCNTPFSVTVGTLFHNTKLPLQKWFLAIAILLETKDKTPARKLGRELEVTKDTAWRICLLIRAEMRNSNKLLQRIASGNNSNAQQGEKG